MHHDAGGWLKLVQQLILGFHQIVHRAAFGADGIRLVVRGSGTKLGLRGHGSWSAFVPRG
jgi:hypothetical protein